MIDFEKRLSSDDASIKSTFELWEVFAYQRGGDHRQKVDRFKLMPPGERECFICMVVAEGNSAEFQRLEWEVDFVDVVRIFAHQEVRRWEPKQS